MQESGGNIEGESTKPDISDNTLISKARSQLKKWFGGRHNQESVRQSPITLKDLLIESAFSLNHAPSLLPQSVDLGKFGIEAEKLMNMTNNDPSQAEYLSATFLDSDGRILMNKNPIRGDEGSVKLPKSHKKRFLLLTHSHPGDSPFSPADLNVLFIPKTETISAPALLLATPSLKMLIFRTNKTPYLSPSEILDLSAMMFHDYGIKDESEIYKHLTDEELEEHEKAGNTNLPYVDEWKKILPSISNRRMFVISRVLNDYNLALYSCPISKNIATRAN